MAIEILPLTPADHADALALWEASEGVELSRADSPEAIAAYLARNPGLSFAAREGGRMVGAVLCGHDARRGYIYHLAVDPACRRRGLGRELVRRCLEGLRAVGIDKVHALVVADNELARRFWEREDWILRTELVLYSKLTGEGGW